ncbi:MAG: PhoU domain-containing protein [Planctomycetota bacterium]
MLEWLKTLGKKDPGLMSMASRLNQMLVDGRHMFDISSSVLLSTADPDLIREDLFRTDVGINANEQKLRRELVVHATVQGPVEFPTSLALMSVARDAERIGDYCKNLFDIAKLRQIPKGHDLNEGLSRSRDRLSELLGQLIDIYNKQDEKQARRFLVDADRYLDHCDDMVEKLISEEPQGAVSASLAYRFFKRIGAHAMNIVSSIVQPIDKINYFVIDGEEKEDD